MSLELGRLDGARGEGLLATNRARESASCCCDGVRGMRPARSCDAYHSSTPESCISQPQYLRRRRAEPQHLLHALPPLAPLAPPVLPSSEPAADVDLNVDYQTEVAPFLGRCLVGSGRVFAAWQERGRCDMQPVLLAGAAQPVFSSCTLAGHCLVQHSAAALLQLWLLSASDSCPPPRTPTQPISLHRTCLQGMGGFGTVYEATWRGRRVAVKKLPQFGPDQPCGEGMYSALLREIELASKFNCERFVGVTAVGGGTVGWGKIGWCACWVVDNRASNLSGGAFWGRLLRDRVSGRRYFAGGTRADMQLSSWLGGLSVGQPALPSGPREPPAHPPHPLLP